MNDYIAAANRNRFISAKMKHDAQEEVLWQIKRIAYNDELCFYHFTWHITNMRKDPDNISSLGRKIIFDALQVAGKIPNDNLKYIAGTADTYILGDELKVVINQIPLTELNGYVTVPIMGIKQNAKRKTIKQNI